MSEFDMNLVSLKRRWYWMWIGAIRIFKELIHDLLNYYWNPYPLLLIVGAIRRFYSRMRAIWLPRPKGRPPITEAIVNLILDMKRSNWGWGAQRISDELRILGISVSKRTVLKILRINGLIPPKCRFTPPSWRAVWHAYKKIWGVDFTTVFDVHGVQLFVFNVIDCVTRKLILSHVTTNPVRSWLKQQIRNCAIANDGILPEAIIHDNDALFGDWFKHTLREMFHIDPIPIPIGCAWRNGHVERFHRSEKEEILRRIPIADQYHAQTLCALYTTYFNNLRTHQGLGGRIPNNCTKDVLLSIDGNEFRYKKSSELLGLATHFKLAA